MYGTALSPRRRGSWHSRVSLTIQATYVTQTTHICLHWIEDQVSSSPVNKTLNARAMSFFAL